MIIFDKLWQTMKERGISQYSLYKNYNISRAQVQRLKKNESVTTHTLNTICEILDCNLEDIAEYKKETIRESQMIADANVLANLI